MDVVFKAIGDPSRRRLMDRLYAVDGLTLGQLAAGLPTMTRFGVMRHLKVLEEAGLVRTRKVGREKHHYLDAAPIAEIQHRWIGKYAESVVDRMAAVKATAEDQPMSKPIHVYEIFIDAPTEAVWAAIVDGESTVRYFYGTRVRSTWEPGAEVVYSYPDGRKASEGEILAIEPGRRLEMTFLPLWDPQLTAEGPAREVWLVEDAGGATKLTVEIWDVPEGGRIHTDFAGGLTFVISGLKTLLETGRPLAITGPDGSV